MSGMMAAGASAGSKLLVAPDATAGHKSAYRSDVDGLRALAVSMVLVFHAFPHAMGGGFIGVDVFFVISGYLISGIIFERLVAGSFSIVDFYIRRVRRIFPALLLVMLACLAAGWLGLLDDEFRKLGKHVTAGAGFVSNLLLWREAGYFDDEVVLKPLLHLWSLGVEEQFYLLWPVLLMLLWKMNVRPFGVCIAVLVLSFVANIGLIDSYREATFYLPVTRFWELMIGAVLAYAAQFVDETRALPAVQRIQAALAVPVIRDVVSWAGLAMILGAAALMGKDSRFPGYWALLPTLGTAMVIVAGQRASLNRVVLSRPLLVYLGLISFPLYLWHWPLLSMARIWNVDPLPASASWVLLAASVALAALTYHGIERPLRERATPRAMRRSAVLLALAMVLVGGLGALVLTGHLKPMSSRFPSMDEVAAASQDIHYDRDRTIAGTNDARKVLMFGDSHMQHYLPRVEALHAAGALPTRTAIFHTRGGCAPVPRIERSAIQCADFVRDGLARARADDVEVVVIAASWAGFMSRGDYHEAGAPAAAPLDFGAPQSQWIFDRWAADLRTLTSAGKQVVVVLGVPRADAFDPKRMVQRGWFDFAFRPRPVQRVDLETPNLLINARLRQVAQASGAMVVDPLDYFCVGANCASTFDDGRPISTDGSHLRASYVSKHLSYLDPFLTLEPQQAKNPP